MILLIILAIWIFVAAVIVLFFRIARHRAIWWQCSWCKWYFSSNGALVPFRHLSDASDPISHGACPDCNRKFLEAEKLK